MHTKGLRRRTGLLVLLSAFASSLLSVALWFTDSHAVRVEVTVLQRIYPDLRAHDQAVARALAARLTSALTLRHFAALAGR